MRMAALQKFVMNVFAVSREYRTAAQKTPENRQRSFKNGQAERNHRNRDGNNRRRLLRALQGKRAQDESDEQASAISQKNSRRAEIKTQKSQNRPGQDQRHQRNQRRTRKQGHGKYNDGRKQSRTRGQTVESIDQVESIRDSEQTAHPQRKACEPGQMVAAEKHGQIEDAMPYGKQHRSSHRLNRNLGLRTY